MEQLKKAYMWQIVKTEMRLLDVILVRMKGITKLMNLLNYGTPPSKNPTLTSTDGMQTLGCG